MANTIKLKRGSGSNPTASDLTQGEIAVRTDTGKLFTKKDDNSVVEISGSGGGGAVDSVNSQTGTVVLDADDISDASTTNKFTTSSDISKLAGIESNATADQTATEIKTAYESNSDTNAFTDAEKTKLSGIASNATVYNDAAVDTHLNTSTASSGEVLSYNGSDYDWVAQSSGGSTDLSYTDATRVIASSTGTDATLPLMSSGNAGLVPASGGGTTSFLRADGQFTAIAASNPVALKLPIAASATLPNTNTEGQVSNLFNTSAVFNSSNSASWSFDASSITIPEDGIYCVSINVQVTSTGQRAQNYFGFAVDGTAQQGRSSHAYVRNSSSINDAGCTLTELLDLDAGDVLTVIGRSEGSITTSRTTDPVTPGSIEIHKVSNTQGPQGAQGADGPSDIPQNSQTSAYTLVAGDNGKHINTTSGGVTVPSGVFSAGNIVSIFNDSSSDQTITQASGVTLRLAGGSSTGNRTLAQYGLCSVLCVGSNEFVISGAGLT